MASTKFRKLDIDLPRQPLTDQRPWLVAGLVLALAILLVAGYAYFLHKKKAASSATEKVSTLL